MRIIFCLMTFVVMLSTLALSFAGCAKSEVQPASKQGTVAPAATPGSPSQLSQSGVQAATTPNAATVKTKVDACALLTSQEIQSVQGEPLKETKASGIGENGFSISQCFFALPTFAKSINLVVTQKGDGVGARDPKEFWETTLDKESKRDRKSEKEHDKDGSKAGDKNREEEEAAPPQKIAGVGDEAFWTGSRVGGALYVLKGNAYLRVSIGGAGDQQAKINKSRALALLALKRL